MQDDSQDAEPSSLVLSDGAGAIAEAPKQIEVWRLDEFRSHSIHLTESVAGGHAEAATHCLDQQGHGELCELMVAGDQKKIVHLVRPKVTEAIRRSHADRQNATEHGAYALALLAAQNLHGYRFTYEVRSKGPGFDYYMSKSEMDIENIGEARLEVSGTFDGDESDIRSRVKTKRTQLNTGHAAEPQEEGTVFYIGVFGYKKPSVWFGEHKIVTKTGTS